MGWLDRSSTWNEDGQDTEWSNASIGAGKSKPESPTTGPVRAVVSLAVVSQDAGK